MKLNKGNKNYFCLLLKHTKARSGGGGGGGGGVGHDFPSIFSKTVVPDVFPTKGDPENEVGALRHLSPF